MAGFLGDGFSGTGGTGVADNLDRRIICNQSNKDATLGGVIDSTKQYFLDGIINMGSTQITIPPGGMSIAGYSFDISGLTSTEDNYTMFISETPVIGSGNLLGLDYLVEVSGTNSKVYELYDATGFNAFEFQRINYINCTSLGDIHGYRQGFEGGTGRFGSSPSLTMHGTWLGGYRITTSIVRNMDDSTTEPLFKAGTAFQMQSRFLTDINCDLGDLQPFCDFAPANFPNASTIQFRAAIFSRGSLFDTSDTNITPNLAASDLPCAWNNNVGILNTFSGGNLNVTAAAQTVISAIDTPVDIAGTFTTTDLQHFDSPANGQLRHIGLSPIEYNVIFDFVLDGNSNEIYEISLIRVDTLAVETVEYTQTRVINNNVGPADIAYFTGQTFAKLSNNELLFWRVANKSSTGNCTLESDSTWFVRER